MPRFVLLNAFGCICTCNLPT